MSFSALQFSKKTVNRRRFSVNKNIHFYVSPKNGWAWLMAVCLAGSAISRIVLYGIHDMPIYTSLWLQMGLPVAATVLYVLITLCNGREQFYKTAIPVWLYVLFSAVWVMHNLQGRMLIALSWLALICFGLVYTDISSGARLHRAWLLFPVMLFPLTTILYYNRQAIFLQDWPAVIRLLPNTLLFLGATVLIFAIRIDPAGEYHPTWGDRVDGRRVRSLPPANQVSPYIMVNRNGSSNLFEEAFEITNVDRYIRQKRREGLTNFGIMHVFLTAYCRGVAKYPGVNRFIAGQKIYSRGEDIQFCMTIKKDMTTDGAETEIKLHLSPRDTVYDVYKKMNDAIVKVKNTPLDAGVDNTAYALTMVPGVVLKFLVWFLKTLDYFGLLPKFLLEVSPFHGSIFFTSMGSLGIPPVYHHLYDFGNLPVFGSFGCKRRALELQEDGTVVQRKYVDFRFTLDERTVDGFYYAAFLKYYKRLIQHPEVLDEAPAEVVKDMD